MKLRIKIGNVEFEADGTEAEVERERHAMMEMLGQFAIPSDITQGNHDAMLLEDGNAEIVAFRSFNEFLNTLTVSKNTDVVMAAAYFLYEFQKVDSFTIKDIEELLIQSHIKRPGNISQSIAQNIKKGYISVVKSDGSKLTTYQVLTTAKAWLERIDK